MLTAPFVIDAFAMTHAAEIKAHRHPASLHKGARQGLHHLVVHGAAKKRVRMGNYRYTHWRLPGLQGWHIHQGL